MERFWRNQEAETLLSKPLPGKVGGLFSYIFLLKNTLRTGWIRYWGVPREKGESVADHAFSMPLLAWFLAKEYEPSLDAERVLKMALVHELGEAIVGDVALRDTHMTPEEKYRKEHEALRAITKDWQAGREALALWEAFEAGETPEARFVKDIDRLEFLLQWRTQKELGIGVMDAHQDLDVRVVEKLHFASIKAVAREILQAAPADKKS